ncbi:Oxygen tolerance [Neorhodopirellula lusitana]|uniref:Oxygen tolerance n=2 Tax=Neorhodopirellula lusitana TaxID=445327 RepID=A0ABY1PNU9_9BACT|nr:Oxygen tolerance [Neorhodopirellula lusitana]
MFPDIESRSALVIPCFPVFRWGTKVGGGVGVRWAMALLAMLLLGMSVAGAAEVNARLSSGQAYVDAPLTLQISIQNVGEFEPPNVPAVDGLEIEYAGAARQSSQQFMINGRVSRRQSVTLQYAVTPRREGVFEIPAMEVSVDGQIVKTSPIGFVASVSETDDLMFVEIEGKQDKVYVGQPLELVLKIWVQPYRDDELDYTLTEAEVWNLISRRSAWGPFQERMDEMTDRRQRPGGEPVVHANADGESKRYFLYEIETTFYPNKPGRIDADGVRIVVNYPVELQLERQRSMLDDFFGGGFGPGMGDPFESGSRMRLTIAKSRPISEAASVDATKIIPIPSEGRPASFQGAVGRYQVRANTDLKQVAAGDPITLQFGISGDGPLDSLQSPPLDSLREKFRMDGQPLAGFVQDGVKYFTTTIRPIEETVSEVPAIEMSFFDPEKEEFETVMTEPIPITVLPAEKLAMDAIVGSDKPDGSESSVTSLQTPSALAWSPLNWMMSNSAEPTVLRNQQPSSLLSWLAWIYLTPACLFVVGMAIRGRKSLAALARLFRSAKQRAERRLQDVSQPVEIPAVLCNYVLVAFPLGRGNNNQDWQACLGTLRSGGHSGLAAELESLAYRCKNSPATREATNLLVEEANRWIENAETARLKRRVLTSARASKARVAAVGGMEKSSAGPPSAGPRSAGNSVAGVVLLLAVLCVGNGSAFAASGVVLLSPDQQGTLLREADEIYRNAAKLPVAESGDSDTKREAGDESPSDKDDGSVAREAFRTAAMKYEQVIDSGVQNAAMYRNLANASFRGGQLGKAIVNYRRAEAFEPLSVKNQASLLAAQVRAGVPVAQWHMPLVWMVVGGVFAWLGWSLLVRALIGGKRTLAIAGLLSLIVSLACLGMVLRQTTFGPGHQAIVVVDQLDVRIGDGEDFEIASRLDGTEGTVVELQQQRGDWSEIVTADSVRGWVPMTAVQQISPLGLARPE